MLGPQTDFGKPAEKGAGDCIAIQRYLSRTPTRPDMAGWAVSIYPSKVSTPNKMMPPMRTGRVTIRAFRSAGSMQRSHPSHGIDMTVRMDEE